jgi:type IV pilus assembly protein PilY1
MTGQLNTTLLDGGGLPPSPVSGIVTVYIDGQKRDLPFIIGGGEGAGNVTGTSRSPLEAAKPLIDPKLPRKRAYWYREVDR